MDERTRTFGELKDEVLQRAGVPHHFAYRRKGQVQCDFWDEMNHVEYKRGYVPGEYEKPGTPALCVMKLLTEDEYQQLLGRAPK